MKQISKPLQILSIGMAMFSMYFGAGNVVFPLLVGQVTQDKNMWAMLGLLLTSVGIPFIGLFAMTLYNGDYREFFSRLGKWPGFFIALVIMGCIGPFGAIPRCIALAYSTTTMFFDLQSIIPFSIVACTIIFFASIKKNRIFDIVGWILTPFFLLTMGLIIVMGICYSPSMGVSSLTISESVFFGFKEGYNTMDLLGSFFFCAVVMQALKRASTNQDVLDQKSLIKNSLYSCLIGAFLMAALYVGMSFVAALYAQDLEGVRSGVLIGSVALKVLGQYAGIVTCVAVIVATLTTAIALASVFSEFISRDICKNKIRYRTALIFTAIVAFSVSTLEFDGIVEMLKPIVKTIYPMLLLLCLVNIGYKLFRFGSAKEPVVKESLS